MLFLKPANFNSSINLFNVILYFPEPPPNYFSIETPLDQEFVQCYTEFVECICGISQRNHFEIYRIVNEKRKWFPCCLWYCLQFDIIKWIVIVLIPFHYVIDRKRRLKMGRRSYSMLHGSDLDDLLLSFFDSQMFHVMYLSLSFTH